MRRGSVVEVGPNRGLRYEVVHIHRGVAWLTPVADIPCVGDILVALDRLREVGSVFPRFQGG
jgi:hypothetical protein